jgi:hypothetical protein
MPLLAHQSWNGFAKGHRDSIRISTNDSAGYLYRLVEIEQRESNHYWLTYRNTPMRFDEQAAGADVFDDISEGALKRSILSNDIGGSARILTLFILGFHFPFTCSRSFAEHLNVTTRLAGRIALAPVAGFLPLRAALSFTQNFPKPEINTSSPDARLDLMISSSDSVISLALSPEMLNCCWICSTMSVFVSAMQSSVLLIFF